MPTRVAEDRTAVEFFPEDRVPGYTHRIVINGQATRYWLGHGKPSAKAAEFFLQQYRKDAPARATVEAKLAAAQYTVEIMVTAAK